MNSRMARLGGVSAAFAVLLAAGILFVAIGDPTDDVETAADTPTTTTSTSTTTTSTTSTTTSVPAPQTTVKVLDFSKFSGLDHDEFSALLTGPTSSTTTTTAAPTTTTAAPRSGPAPVSIPRPSCAAGLGGAVSQTGPFTGTSASIPAGLPAVVVKVSNNNSSSRRALIGLDRADIVFEERIEYSATRFAAVFHSDLPANVGPVRSGRTTDINLLRPLGRPVLGYSGSNPGVAGQFADAAAAGWFVPVVNTDRSPFARDSRYNAPDNLFVDPTSLGACGNGGTPSPIFAYGAANSTTAQPASSVSLDARSPYRFDYDAGTGTWVRSQSGTRHVTREGASLAPENVIVMFVPYQQSQIDASSVDAITTGSGDAWIFRDGTITQGRWNRSSASSPFALGDGTGARLNLKPGQTWVVLQPGGAASWN